MDRRAPEPAAADGRGPASPVAVPAPVPAAGVDMDFELRALRSETELGPWLDLVAHVFGPLGIPRAFFARHWTSDPEYSQVSAPAPHAPDPGWTT